MRQSREQRIIYRGLHLLGNRLASNTVIFRDTASHRKPGEIDADSIAKHGPDLRGYCVVLLNFPNISPSLAIGLNGHIRAVQRYLETSPEATLFVRGRHFDGKTTLISAAAE
jgi:hypothetical protein